MIDFKEALNAAIEAAKDFYGEEAKDLRLEEVQMPRDAGYWDITLGFLLPEANPPQRGLMDVFGDKNMPRRYERRVITESGV